MESGFSLLPVIGGGLGALGVLLVLSIFAKTSRDEVVLPPGADIRATVAGWAAANGFTQRPSERGLLFRKGSGVFGPATVVEVILDRPQQELHTYMMVNLLFRNRTSALSSGPFRERTSRRRAAKKVAPLFESLGLPLAVA